VKGGPPGCSNCVAQWLAFPEARSPSERAGMLRTDFDATTHDHNIDNVLFPRFCKNKRVKNFPVKSWLQPGTDRRDRSSLQQETMKSKSI